MNYLLQRIEYHDRTVDIWFICDGDVKIEMCVTNNKEN